MTDGAISKVSYTPLSSFTCKGGQAWKCGRGGGREEVGGARIGSGRGKMGGGRGGDEKWEEWR